MSIKEIDELKRGDKVEYKGEVYVVFSKDKRYSVIGISNSHSTTYVRAGRCKRLEVSDGIEG